MSDDLIDFEQERTLSREDAAAWLHQLADSLARHNSFEFVREGLKYTVKVPNEVELEVEIEIGADGTSLEIEINW
jgi:amphi-Trp domain-containing protein